MSACVKPVDHPTQLNFHLDLDVARVKPALDLKLRYSSVRQDSRNTSSEAGTPHHRGLLSAAGAVYKENLFLGKTYSGEKAGCL